MIRTEYLSKQFGSIRAVDGVNLHVAAGEILALLGPNGAGKTTTIRMLASILQPSSGRALVAGMDTTVNGVEIRRLIGLLTEHHGLYTRMRSEEYLQFFGLAYGLTKQTASDRAVELLHHLDLWEARKHRLGQYSKGMRQKLALCRALIHDPSVLLFDEPTSAMDPSSARLVRQNIVDLRSSRRAIVVCTHNLAEAEKLADRIAIIHQGRIVAQGTVSELKKELLGDPIMEVRYHGSLDGVVERLPPSSEVLEFGEGWLRYEAADPGSTNPMVLKIMAEAGVEVVTLSEVVRSLEEIYLSVVEQHEEEILL